MEILMLIFLVLCVGVFFALIKSLDLNSKQQKAEKLKYKYYKKDYLMTARENQFFIRLNQIFGQKFYIFPQVHLDALLNHRLKNQNWQAALSKIQRKSVDYAFYKKMT